MTFFALAIFQGHYYYFWLRKGHPFAMLEEGGTKTILAGRGASNVRMEYSRFNVKRSSGSESFYADINTE